MQIPAEFLEWEVFLDWLLKLKESLFEALARYVWEGGQQLPKGEKLGLAEVKKKNFAAVDIAGSLVII